MEFLDTEEKRQRRLVHLPMGRFGEAVEIAQAALFCECFVFFLAILMNNVLGAQWRAMRAVMLQ